MSIGSGMSAQVGWELEGTVGEVEAPAVFVPLLGETLTQDIARDESDAVEARRVLRSVDWSPGERTISGDLHFELYTRGLGKLFLLMFGAVTTTQIGVTRWAHTFTTGNLTGTAASIQVGKPTTGALVVPFTYSGCKAASWELAVAAGEFATLAVGVAAMSETTGEPLGAAVMPTNLQCLIGHQATLTLDGAPLAGIRSLRLAGDNALDTDRRPVTNSTTPDEALEDGRRVLSGTLDGEFRSMDAYQRFLDGTEAALTFTLTDLAGESVSATANVRFDTKTPTVDGRGLLAQSVPFTCAAPEGDDSALTVTVTNDSPTP